MIVVSNKLRTDLGNLLIHDLGTIDFLYDFGAFLLLQKIAQRRRASV